MFKMEVTHSFLALPVAPLIKHHVWYANVIRTRGRARGSTEERSEPFYASRFRAGRRGSAFTCINRTTRRACAVTADSSNGSLPKRVLELLCRSWSIFPTMLLLSTLLDDPSPRIYQSHARNGAMAIKIPTQDRCSAPSCVWICKGPVKI